MKILTRKNGIALVAVLTVLLVLTLLLPAMFTMADRATKSAMRGTDELKASYLSRTMLEMSVAAFEDFYDMADEGQKDASGKPYADKLQSFMTSGATVNTDVVYMYNVGDIPFPDENATEAELEKYEKYGVVYSTTAPAADNTQVLQVPKSDGSDGTESKSCICIGQATCALKYDNDTKYYEVDQQGNTTLIDEEKYIGGAQALEQLISQGTDVTSQNQYIKIQNKNVVFVATATVNGKGGTRRCVMVLPTKPSEENWISPATLGSNQIFPDTSKATGRTNISYDASEGIGSTDGRALKQPLYIFSCMGNMVISDENMTYEGQPYTTAYPDYDRTKMSFGLHPETGTREPDNDPQFNCLRTYNMDEWAADAQLDNFVAFSATNAIQVDLPVNLIINPARANRIGDGLDKNASLYKVLIFQAPVIVFNRSVNSFVSLYMTDNAYRMTTVMFSAPANTPYSYLNGDRKKTVRAGKVYFAEDVYVWVVPYGENGSGYNTQTVYYKGKDIILYKIADAGDIYYFNSEVETQVTATGVNGKPYQKDATSGFSLTGYFMDVYYSESANEINTNTEWWKVWSKAKYKLFNSMLENYSEPTYVKDDFKWVGNIYSGAADKVPVVDDFYVVWES